MIAYHDDLRFGGKLGSSREVGVIQYLADSNPDIDAIHRLSKPLPMTFPLDGELPVLVPTHAYSPYNAQATIHTRNAMFAMFLPSTVPGRVSDIWRGYFAQCIFADTGLSLVFFFRHPKLCRSAMIMKTLLISKPRKTCMVS